MKVQGHPQYFENAQVICACGNKFTTGSTQEVIHVELCGKCHPFYTGEQRFVDTGSRIEKFQDKQKVAVLAFTKKKGKRSKKRQCPQDTPRNVNGSPVAHSRFGAALLWKIIDKHKLRNLDKKIEETKSLLNDPELAGMAKAEIENLENQKQEILRTYESQEQCRR